MLDRAGYWAQRAQEVWERRWKESFQPQRWLANARCFLRETSIEVALGATVGFFCATPFFMYHEYKLEGSIPLGFSEISQIEREAKQRGETVGPVTYFYAFTSDTPMKVFESWNEAHAKLPFFSFERDFARELEICVEPTFKIHHYNLPALTKALPALAQQVTYELRDFKGAHYFSRQAADNFNEAWKDSHIDHYRTEYYTDTETYTDSDGKTHSRTVTKSRQVYDYTTHSYTYNRDAGERASDILDSFYQKYPSLAVKERMRRASTTNAEGEYAALKSRRAGNRDPVLGRADYNKIAHTWIDGSTLQVNLSDIQSILPALHHEGHQWREAKKTARSTSYITYSHFDRGPKEFQIAEEALTNSRAIEKSIREIFEGIEYVKNFSPILEQKVRDFIDTEINYQKKGNSKKLRNEIIGISRTWYEKNFKKGFNVNPFRWYMIVLGGLAGAFVGSAAGAGINYLGDRYNWYSSRQEGKAHEAFV